MEKGAVLLTACQGRTTDQGGQKGIGTGENSQGGQESQEGAGESGELPYAG